MPDTADKLLGRALKLTDDERARLVAELLATLEPDLPSEQRSEHEWIQEIERRVHAALAGSPGVSWVDARGQDSEAACGAASIQLAAEAIDELTDAAAWYRLRRPGLELEFLAKFASVLPLIERAPATFPRLRDMAPDIQVRGALLPRFP